MNKILTALMHLIVFSVSAVCAGWSPQGKIKDLRIIAGDKIYGKLNGISLGCGNSNFRLDLGVDLSKEIYSTMLAAVMTNRTVTVYETGACDSSDRTIISGVNLLE